MKLAEQTYRIVRHVDVLPLALLDTGVILGAYLCAALVAWQGKVPLPHHDPAIKIVVVLIGPLLVQLALNRAWGLYGPVWKYASVDEAARILAAASTGAAVAALPIMVSAQVLNESIPLALFPVACLLMLLGLGGVRFQARLFALRVLGETDKADRVTRTTRALIVGAGAAGAALVTEIRSNRDLGLEPIGFIDDDPRKAGRWLRRLPVLGDTESLPAVCKAHEIDLVVVAIPSATSGEIRRVLDLARLSDARVQVLPPVLTMGDKATLGSLRDIEISDLLGRQQVHVDTDELGRYLAGEVVLVTGAGGSIGSELVRQIARFGPRRLLALDHDETHLHDLLATIDADVEIEPVLADIRERERVREVFRRYRPAVVFHAAAHKHVPLLQSHANEAVKTNVVGSRNVVEAAADHGTGTFVLVSTDKAANPRSIMGATKRVAELLVHDVGRRHGGRYVSVRFGNVVGSRGSVVPTFLAQIEAGGPVTVTHPDVTRYFMSIPEAAALVLQAGALAEGGDILTLEMGDPVRIGDLAVQMIRLAGLRPNVDIDVVVTGLRPGERLHEQLSDDSEVMGPTAHPSVNRVLSSVETGSDWNDIVEHLCHLAYAAPGAETATVLQHALSAADVTCSIQLPDADIDLVELEGSDRHLDEWSER